MSELNEQDLKEGLPDTWHIHMSQICPIHLCQYPPNHLKKINKVKRNGVNKRPNKRKITIRFSQDIEQAFRATGSGWQGRVNAALLEWLQENDPSRL